MGIVVSYVSRAQRLGRDAPERELASTSASTRSIFRIEDCGDCAWLILNQRMPLSMALKVAQIASEARADQRSSPLPSPSPLRDCRMRRATDQGSF
jgi:hypothetical protein